MEREWKVRRQMAKLRAQAADRDDLATIVRRLGGVGGRYEGAGFRVTVIEGKRSLDAEALLDALARAMDENREGLRRVFTKAGDPYLAFSSAGRRS
jgi:hypothetical protein